MTITSFFKFWRKTRHLNYEIDRENRKLGREINQLKEKIAKEQKKDTINVTEITRLYNELIIKLERKKAVLLDLTRINDETKRTLLFQLQETQGTLDQIAPNQSKTVHMGKQQEHEAQIINIREARKKAEEQNAKQQKEAEKRKEEALRKIEAKRQEREEHIKAHMTKIKMRKTG